MEFAATKARSPPSRTPLNAFVHHPRHWIAFLSRTPHRRGPRRWRILSFAQDRGRESAKADFGQSLPRIPFAPPTGRFGLTHGAREGKFRPHRRFHTASRKW